MAAKLDDVFNPSKVEAIEGAIRDNAVIISKHIYSSAQKLNMNDAPVITELIRLPVDFGDHGVRVQKEKTFFNVSAFLGSTPGAFDIRLFNVTDAGLLATANFSETIPTIKPVPFILPQGEKIIALEWLRIGGGPSLDLELQYVDMTWKVSP